jgi:hypothetical protein
VFTENQLVQRILAHNQTKLHHRRSVFNLKWFH